MVTSYNSRNVAISVLPFGQALAADGVASRLVLPKHFALMIAFRHAVGIALGDQHPASGENLEYRSALPGEGPPRAACRPCPLPRRGRPRPRRTHRQRLDRAAAVRRCKRVRSTRSPSFRHQASHASRHCRREEALPSLKSVCDPLPSASRQSRYSARQAHEKGASVRRAIRTGTALFPEAREARGGLVTDTRVNVGQERKHAASHVGGRRPTEDVRGGGATDGAFVGQGRQ